MKKEVLKEGGRYYPEYVEAYEPSGRYHLLTECHTDNVNVIIRVSNPLENEESVEDLKKRSMEEFIGYVRELIEDKLIK